MEILIGIIGILVVWMKCMPVTNSKSSILSQVKRREILKGTVFYRLTFILNGLATIS